MRIAAILAVLARSLDKSLFKPTYLLEDDGPFRKLSFRLAIEDRSKESFSRALLLSVFPEEQEVLAEDRAAIVVRDVMKITESLLSPEMADSFRSDLKSLVQKASNVWSKIQRMKERVEPSFEPIHYENVDWQMLRLHEDTATTTGETPVQGGRDHILLVVFPRLYVADGTEPKPVTPGVVVMQSQSVGASREWDRTTYNSFLTRSSPFRARTSSLSEPQTNGKEPFLASLGSLNEGADGATSK